MNCHMIRSLKKGWLVGLTGGTLLFIAFTAGRPCTEHGSADGEWTQTLPPCLTLRSAQECWEIRACPWMQWLPGFMLNFRHAIRHGELKWQATWVVRGITFISIPWRLAASLNEGLSQRSVFKVMVPSLHFLSGKSNPFFLWAPWIARIPSQSCERPLA